VTSTRSLASGFSMKSNAPSLVASTAVLGAARRFGYVIAFVLEDHLHRSPDFRLVVYDENP
jgi:hypothetical protein